MNTFTKTLVTGFTAGIISLSAAAAPAVPDLLLNVRSDQTLELDPGIRNLAEYDSARMLLAVTVNLDALQQDSASFNFNLDGNSPMIVRRTDSMELGDGYHAWHGSVEIPKPDGPHEVDADAVNFVVSGDRVFGQIRVAGNIFELRTTQTGKHFLVQRDFRKLGHKDDTPRQSYTSSSRSAAGPQRGGNTVIRVMQIASSAAISAQGGTGPIVDLMNFYISQSNQAYAATGIPITLQNAGLFQATNPERATAQQNVSGLRNLSDGFQDALANSTRNSRTADLVGMIVATPADGGICGIVNAIGGGATNGFFVVKNVCTDFTFVHEIGHLFGARHQNDNTTTPFAYGHGIADTVGNFRSIMGTASTGLPRIGGFSNPDFTVGGRPFGTASFRDNDRVHRERANTVAAFR
ncbi:MAG: zinc-dependent metalloprotease [Gammaproteobacteria bacterium]|nr:zinc-dependent metalloprotease [Gammaproteobacteria bacterium]